MPPSALAYPSTSGRAGIAWACGATIAVVLASAVSAAPASDSNPISVRARVIELHYRTGNVGPSAEVELWYTRDRGVSWLKYGTDPDGASPFAFTAPAEGLYGFRLIVRDEHRASSGPPVPGEPAQRWAFIDYTPPLAQWDSVEAAEGFTTRRILQLRWTAHDDSFQQRPVSLAYQSSIDQTWHVIEAAVANVGRYDWKVPEGAGGQITLKLTVQDQGGHVVTRLHGPVPVDQWIASSVVVDSAKPVAATTRPVTQAATAWLASDVSATTMPSEPEARVAIDRHRQAEERYQQGTRHRRQGQPDLAIERFREAIELDPNMLKAVNDLAGVYYDRKDYAKAVDLYNQVLSKDSTYALSLEGAALAYVAQKQYPQSRDMLKRLLAIDENNPEAWLNLGDVLFFMGDRSSALAHWSRVTGLTSPTPVVDQARRRLQAYGQARPAAEKQ